MRNTAFPASAERSIVEPGVAELYDTFSDRLLRFALALTRDRDGSHDCVQETFARYLELSRGGSIIPNPGAWMFTVVRRLALDRARKARLVQPVTDVVPLKKDVAQAPANGDEDRAWKEIEATLAWILSPRELDCVRLRAEGLTHAEVARRLGVKTGTVSSLLSRASRKARVGGVLPVAK